MPMNSLAYILVGSPTVDPIRIFMITSVHLPSPMRRSVNSTYCAGGVVLGHARGGVQPPPTAATPPPAGGVEGGTVSSRFHFFFPHSV